MRPVVSLCAIVLVLAGCGGDGGGSAFAGVEEAEARSSADKEAREREQKDDNKLVRVEMREGATKKGDDAWYAVYADQTGEYEDLCVWVYREADADAPTVESDDCPSYVGVTHATARIEGQREAISRGKRLGAEFDFVSLTQGKDDEGNNAWQAVYEDESDKVGELCVWIKTDLKDKTKNLITSDDCPEE